MRFDLVQIGERIRIVRGNKSGSEFGKSIGVSTNMISNYEKGQAWPKAQTLARIIELSRKSADWLLYGNEDDAVAIEGVGACLDIITIPVRAMAGAGDPCDLDQLEPIGHITIESEYNGPSITALLIRGTSMEPNIMNGAHVGVDRTDREIISGQLYAIYIPHEGIVVKRIFVGPELVKIKSDNPTFPDHDMSIDRINWDTFVMGRVKWVLQKY